MYDTLVDFERGTKTQYNCPEAVERQAAQLRDGGCQEYGKVTEIHVKPCMQQQDSYNCGVLTIANMISLAMGYDPQNIIYTGTDMRNEL